MYVREPWPTLLWWCQEAVACWEQSSPWQTRRTWAPCWHGWCRCPLSCSPDGKSRPPCWRLPRGTVSIKVKTRATYWPRNLDCCNPCHFTFDLIVQGHCRVGNPLTVHPVQDSAHDREAHHTEHWLHTMSSYCSFHGMKTFAKQKHNKHHWTLPPVSGCCAPPWSSCGTERRRRWSSPPCRRAPAAKEQRQRS